MSAGAAAMTEPEVHGAASHGAEHAAAAAMAPGSLGAVTGTLPSWVLLVPFMPLVGVVLVTLCAIFRVKSKLPAWITVGCLAVSFAAALGMYLQTIGISMAGVGHHQTAVVHAWDWIHLNFAPSVKGEAAPALIANFSFYVDSLTCLWMMFVTGLATLIALYASEYMSHDVGPGYNRFFAAFGLFVFSMACLVMADNLLLLFLGWEGVGLCSYLLIGYFYKKPSAVAAAKKAFIMNRIGDLGLAMGVMLTFVQFGTVEFAKLFPLVQTYWEMATHGELAKVPFLVQLIPVLFTVGAFGKSAQLPLYVWLPDAMEGPTPVSALIHAATMVTAGVYLVARFFPMFLASAWALDIVAWTGALTALLSATIAMSQFDIKRIMAYSTVSQLGYMFCGLSVMSTVGGVSHVFTHAFFKAMLFLSCGAVMHGFAGQLDLRRLSGLGKMPGWRVVTLAMLVGCINLAGVPIVTAGFFSKDQIIGDDFQSLHLRPVAIILLITAGLTAYYTFRVFFRVFMGPKHYEAGEELHAADGHADAHGHDHGHAPQAGHGADAQDGHFHPHAPGWAINLVLLVIAVASFGAIPLVSLKMGPATWAGDMVKSSTAGVTSGVHGEHEYHGFDVHTLMMVISGAVAIGGIAVAYWLHLAGRTTAAKSRADSLLPLLGPIPRWAQHKWYVDELYDVLIVKPLYVLAHILHLIDKLLVDGLVNLAGFLPKAAGHGVRRQQTGVLHDYALRMAMGLALVVIIALVARGGGLK